MNETPASLSLRSHNIPVMSLSLNSWQEGRNERLQGRGNRATLEKTLVNALRFKSWGMAGRAAGWLAEDDEQTQPITPAMLPAPCPADLAPYVARVIASRYEELI